MSVNRADCDRAMKKLGTYLLRWKRDPVAYVIECCGDTPTHQQARFLRAVQRYGLVAARSGHGVGKTKALAWLIHWYLDTHKEKGASCRVPCTGPAGSSLTDVLWTELAAVRESKLPWLRDKWILNNERMHCTEGFKDWFAVVRTARHDNPDALQGFHRCLFVIDEASGVPDEVMEVMRGAMGDEGTYAAMTGNPTRTDGYFYEAFHKGKTWHKLHFPSTDSLTDTEYSYDYVDPRGEMVTVKVPGRQRREWVEDMAAEFGIDSDTYRIRVSGIFGSGGVETLIPASAIDSAFEREPRDVKDRKRVLGVDVAWTGLDDTACVLRQGESVVFASSWHGADLVETATRVEAIAKELKVDQIMVDTIGVGAGVYDMLRRKGLPASAVATNIPAPDDNDAECKTLRDWLWWRARIFFKQKVPSMKGPASEAQWKKLAEEMASPRFDYKSGALRVESKDEMKKRGVRSPNLGDALCLTMGVDFHAPGTQLTRARAPAKKRKGLNVRRSWACA